MPVREVLTPNEVVAYNLAQARRLRRLTQEEAAQRLERYLGVRWSKAVFSSAERSIAGVRVREFTADEIVAFARAFELPVTWFFLPPGGEADRGEGALPLVSPRKGGPDRVEDTLTPAELLRLLWGEDLTIVLREVFDRIDTYEAGVDAALARSAATEHLQEWMRAIVADALASKSGSRLGSLGALLQQVAGQLEVLNYIVPNAERLAGVVRPKEEKETP